MADFTEEELAGMSTEERAALEDDSDDATAAELDAIAGDDAGGEGDDDDKAAVAAAAAGKTDEEKDAAEKAAEDKSAAGEDEAAKAGTGGDADDDAGGDDDTLAVGDSGPFSPHLAVEPVEDYAKKIEALEAKETDLDAQFEKDDIEYKAYRIEQRAIQREQRDLERQQERSEDAAEHNKQMGQERWRWEVGRFMDDTKQAGETDYREDDALRAQLDQSVRIVASSPEGEKMTGRQILEEADKWVKARNFTPGEAGGDTDAAKKIAAEKAAADKAAAAKAAGRKPNLAAVPATLSKVPAADINDTGTGDAEFAAIDKMDTLEQEAALAKMPKDKADRYLRETG
jgi:hypothetical protein